MSKIDIIEILGDGIGADLRETVHAIAEVLPLDF